MLQKLLFTVFFVLVSGASFAAPLNVVATSTATAALVNEVAGDAADVTTLGPPDRDLHHLRARPSMIRALRNADLLVATGAELEQGWLPVAIGSSTNANIQVGQIGYFEAAAQVELLDVHSKADRSLGDIHPAGNPHVTMDPIRMGTIAKALAERLSELAPAKATMFEQRAAAFADKAAQKTSDWQQRAQGHTGVLMYHRDAVYFLDRLNLPLLGLVEPVAGVPPTASHLEQLVTDLEAKQGRIVTTVYQPQQAVQTLSQQLQWPSVQLPLEPPLDADGDAYLAHMESWLQALLGEAQP